MATCARSGNRFSSLRALSLSIKILHNFHVTEASRSEASDSETLLGLRSVQSSSECSPQAYAVGSAHYSAIDMAPQTIHGVR